MPLNLPRLENVRTEIVSQSRRATGALQRWWQTTAESIEGAVDDIATNVSDIATAQSDISDTQTEQAAQLKAIRRVGSYPRGLAPTATDAGSDATITVDNHTRVYFDATTQSVNGGSITGLSYSTTYYVYYDDTTLSNNSPTYQATTTANDAQPQKADGRHYVCAITTPAAAAGPTSPDEFPTPPGGSPDAVPP